VGIRTLPLHDRARYVSLVLREPDANQVELHSACCGPLIVFQENRATLVDSLRFSNLSGSTRSYPMTVQAECQTGGERCSVWTAI